MADQVPSIHKKFLLYKDYAKAGLTDLLTKEQLQNASTITAKTLQSVYLENKGNKQFAIHPLPNHAQLSTLNGLIAADVDADGNKDIILAGNFYPFRVQTGPLDASIGLVLKNDGKGNFSPLVYDKTGMILTGDVRNMISIKNKNGFCVVAGKNDGKVQCLQFLN
jgi:hypothetical protein